MYCKICGATLTPGDVFCKNCGASNNNATEPKAPEVEPVVASEPSDTMNMIEEAQPEQVPNVEPPQADVVEPPQMDPVEPVESGEPVEVEPTQVNEVEPNNEVIEGPIKEEPTEAPKPDVAPENQPQGDKEDKSGKFLMIIGVVVGVLAIAVIAYLVYSSLVKNKGKETGGNVIFVSQTGYAARYAGYTFEFNYENAITVGEVIDISNTKWLAKLYYVESPKFSSLTVDNVKKTLDGSEDYKIGEVVSKTYNGISCFETNITYTSNAKTNLLLCNRSVGGYWIIEVGAKDYASFPTSDINAGIVKLIADAKEIKEEENNLKVGKVQVEVEDTTETENQ